jgi:cation diffusion facilitator family transporter
MESRCGTVTDVQNEASRMDAKQHEFQDRQTDQPLDFKSEFTAMLAAFIVGIGLMGLKFLGYWVTGSSAILSDALESIINVVASGFGLGSIVMAARPADESHPYGHGKIEFFSAGFEGALIILAAIGIFIEGMKQVLHPLELPDLHEGLLFLIIAGAGNLALGLVLTRIGRRTRSLVLQADGKHLLTDVYTSVAVLLGVGLVYFTGWYRLDGVVACVAGANIVFWGVRLLREAAAGLMDRSDPELLDQICDLLAEHKREVWIGVHRLRAWKSGKGIHVDFHLVLPRELPLEHGHREVKELEQVFSRQFGGMSDVLIHLDPCEAPECPECFQDPCKLREAAVGGRKKPWNRQAMTNQIER